MKPRNKTNKTQKKEKNGELEIYNTKNIIIKILSYRFLSQIKLILKGLNAYSKTGLDAGCGEGQLLNTLYNEKIIYKIIATDINENRLKYAKTNNPIFNYLKQDITCLGFETNSFDYVIATEIFEHLYYPYIAIEELKRVTKKRMADYFCTLRALFPFGKFTTRSVAG